MKRITAEQMVYTGKPRKLFPALFDEHIFSGAKSRYAEGKEGQMICQYATAGDIIICYSVLKFESEAIEFTSHRALSGIHISLQGGAYFLDENTRCNINEYAVCFFDFSKKKFRLQPKKNGFYVCLDIFFPFIVLQKHLSMFPLPEWPQLHAVTSPVDSSILDNVQRMQRCNFTGAARKTFLQLKAHEMLLSAAALFAVDKKDTPQVSVEARNKMQALRNFLDENYTTHFTIVELARKFAINTTTLKFNFQQVFGTGLYTYLVTVRMQKGKELVELGKSSINDIAYLTGYKSAGAFIRAFKKQFGYTPAHKHP